MRPDRYLITCPAGLEALLADSLLRADPGAVIDTRLSGLAVLRSSLPESVVVGQRCASNVFRVLGERGFPAGGKGGRLPDPSAALLRALSADGVFRGFGAAPGSTFRVMLSSENELIPPDRQALARAEAAIALGTGMSPRRAGADTEFWLILRGEGRIYFCQRLSRRRATERDLAKGELKPEIAFALAVAAGIRGGERILDPFCGSGAIPLECLDAFPDVEVVAGDADGEAVRRLEESARGKPRLRVLRADFLDPGAYPPASFAALLTDPPWGSFRDLADPLAFYSAFLRSCARVLSEGGKLAFISGAKEACAAALEAQAGQAGERIALRARHDFLVSGKKAALWSCEKV